MRLADSVFDPFDVEWRAEWEVGWGLRNEAGAIHRVAKGQTTFSKLANVGAGPSLRLQIRRGWLID